MTLDPVQREAIGAALKHKMLILTGGPGVGKTTLVQAIVRIFRAKNLRVHLCAPTGRAAKRLSESTRLTAKTIHRLLVYEPETHSFRHNAGRPIEGDLFVIDECSMLDVVLASQLLRAIPSRAAVLWVGDVDQLPSVGPGAVLADLIESGEVPTVRLSRCSARPRKATSSPMPTGSTRASFHPSIRRGRARRAISISLRPRIPRACPTSSCAWFARRYPAGLDFIP